MSDAAGVITKPMDEYKQSKAQKQRSPYSNTSTIAVDQTLEGKQSADSSDRLEPSQPSDQPMARTSSQTAGAMAAASAKSFGNVIARPCKSIFVDVPLAVTDGLHAVPKLYGSEVKERDRITDMKSGTIVTGKSFVLGVSRGLKSLIMEPYKGGKKEGALGR